MMVGNSSVVVAIVIAAIAMGLYKFFLVKIDFQGIGNVLWYKLIEPPLPTQPVHWLQNWTDKSSRLAALGIPSDHIEQARKELPNILFILADDLGFNELSDYSFAPDALGKRLGADTPNINSIRYNGVNFMQSYSGHSTCTPSRAALLTGQYSTKLGIEFTPTPPFLARFASRKRGDDEVQPIFHEEFFDIAPHLHNLTLIPRDKAMLADYLDHAGYHSYFLGKWDSGYGPERSPRKHGYDESLCFPYGGSLYSYFGDPNLVTPGEFHADLDWILTASLAFFVQHNDGPRFQPDRYMTDYLTEQGVSLIRQLAAKNDPWHIMMAYNAVHNPFQATREDYNTPELAHVPAGIPRIYAAMLRALDRGVGRLLEELRATNQWDNTVVIFTSDNGGAEYTGVPHINAPFRGWKLSLFEGGVRVPFFLQWPQGMASSSHSSLSSKDRDVHAITSHVDVVPTFVDIIDGILRRHANPAQPVASIVSPQSENLYQASSMDGFSFWPFVQNATLTEEEAQAFTYPAYPAERKLFWRSGHYKAMRMGRWKMQIAQHPHKVWFFDLHRDPTEHHNLAATVLQLRNADDVAAFCRRQTSREGEATEEEATGDALCHVYAAMMAEEAQQVPPLWHPLSELPLCIDNVGGVGTTLKCLLRDEHVVIPN